MITLGSLFIIRGIATYLTDYGMARIARGVVATLRAEVFDKYLRLPTAFFNREPASHQIARMTYTHPVYTAGAVAAQAQARAGFAGGGQRCQR